MLLKDYLETEAVFRTFAEAERGTKRQAIFDPVSVVIFEAAF
jgi:hypothetical protein